MSIRFVQYKVLEEILQS